MKRASKLRLMRAARSLSGVQKFAVLLAVDIFSVPLAMWVALQLDTGTLRDSVEQTPQVFLWMTLCMALAGAGVSLALGLPWIRLKSYELRAIQRTVLFAAALGVIGVMLLDVLTGGAVSSRVVAVFAMSLAMFAVGARIVMRDVLTMIYKRGALRQRVLIYGAGQTGLQLARALESDDAVEPVAFVDDKSTLHKVMVAGLPVHSPIRIEDLIQEKQIDRVVLAMPSISRPKQARIARRVQELGCEVSVLPSFAALVGEGNLIGELEALAPSEYLNRVNLECDLDGLCGIYDGTSVMITGAGGSIGAEMVRQLLACRPAKVVLYEISEIALYQLLREFEELNLPVGTQIVPVLGSVTDPVLVRDQIKAHGVTIVLHAAAYKHVNIVETNVLAAVRNNVTGTRIVAEAARDAQIDHFILVSTDKAVRATSIMGATKRLAELLVQDIARRSDKTRYAIVRFGNVLGSSGSVVPLFAEQIGRGGPVTLTHTDVTRYFMTLSEAARLLLLAGNYAKGGEMFVLDMGKPVLIRKLAEQMIAAAGYTVCDAANPDGDIEIVVQGLKPGEKLQEELFHPDGELVKTAHPKIMQAREAGLTELETARALRALTKAIEKADPDAARRVLHHWAGGYQRMPENASALQKVTEVTTTTA